jgi:PAS domain S-box-containing protein
MGANNHILPKDFEFNKETFVTLIEVLPGFIYRCKNDNDWTMLYTSNQVKEITGFSSEEINFNSEISFNEIISHEYRLYLHERWHSVLKSRGVLKEEYKIVRKDGSVRWVLEQGKGVFDTEGNLKYLDGYITDITSLKMAEDRLVQKNIELHIAKERAEEGDKMKTAFLANLSHEIRTPMNAIIGFAEMLKEDDLEKDQRDSFIDIINRSGIHLLSIINDIIEMSKIESKLIKPNYEEVDVDLLIDVVYKTMYATLPEDKSLEFRYLPPDNSLEYKISTDPVKLRQILSNLLSNSIKYTDNGYVEFWYEISNKTKNKHILFYVKDTGIGIDKTYKDEIFERFRRIESDVKSGGRGGSGLGLAISKAYVEMLGGDIEVESEYGRGSLFKFSIPLILCSRTNRGTELIEKEFEMNNQMRILVAEDEDTNFLYLSALLSKFHHTVLRAVNGKEAVEIVKEDNRLDLVLMDIKMPILNGYDALREIKKFKPSLPVVAQTAYALSDDEQNIRAAGFDDYIAKPIMKNKLVTILESITKHL